MDYFYIHFFLLLLAAVIIAWFSFGDSYDDAVRNSEHSLNGCAGIIRYILNRETLEVLTDPSKEEEYEHIRNLMRLLSKDFEFDYLYVYTVDPDTKVREYVICVASDDEKDKSVSEVRGRGSKSDAPLDEGELSALNGTVRSEPVFQSTKFGDDLVWVYPYMDKAGNVKALIGMEYNYKVSEGVIIKDMIKIFLPVVFILMTTLLILLFLINKRIADPLHRISARMNSFVADRNKPAVPLNIQSVEEINEIAVSFEKMSGDIMAYMQNIEALTREQMKARFEMDIASKIQNGLVPKKIEVNRENFSLSAITCPAREVGGDFYDCLESIEGELCVFIGDVSGKGLSAALLMAAAKAVIRENLKNGKNPAEALEITNNELCVMNPEGLFVTAFAFILNLQTGELHYANAGHNYPVMLGQDVCLLHPDPGIVLGLFEDAEIQEGTLYLKEGQGIVLYTDGVTEAVNDQRVFFGEKRLLDAVRNDDGTNAFHTIEEITGALNSFSGSCEQFDDIAILALWYTNTGKKEEWELLPVDHSAFTIVKEKIFDMIGKTETARKALLACDEILANIVKYSGADRLAFYCTEEKRELIVRFSDNGVCFDPVRYSSEEKPFDLLDRGGMGLNIVRQIVLEMRYERTEDNNIVTLIFSL